MGESFELPHCTLLCSATEETQAIVSKRKHTCAHVQHTQRDREVINQIANPNKQIAASADSPWMCWGLRTTPSPLVLLTRARVVITTSRSSFCTSEAFILPGDPRSQQTGTFWTPESPVVSARAKVRSGVSDSHE